DTQSHGEEPDELVSRCFNVSGVFEIHASRIISALRSATEPSNLAFSVLPCLRGEKYGYAALLASFRARTASSRRSLAPVFPKMLCRCRFTVFSLILSWFAMS